MRPLHELRALGFVPQLEGGDVRISFRGGRVPDPAATAPLFAELRERKGDLVATLQAEQEMARRETFRAALRTVEEHWLHGLLSHVQRKHPDMWQQITQVEARLETAWEGAKLGATTDAEFTQAVDGWRDTYMQAVKAHEARGCATCTREQQDICMARVEGGNTDGSCVTLRRACTPGGGEDSCQPLAPDRAVGLVHIFPDPTGEKFGGGAE